MDELLKPKQAAKLLNVSQSLIYSMAERGQLPCVRWDSPSADGKRKKTTVRFHPEDVWTFIEEHRSHDRMERR